jgi:hypothetical protein
MCDDGVEEMREWDCYARKKEHVCFERVRVFAVDEHGFLMSFLELDSYLTQRPKSE